MPRRRDRDGRVWAGRAGPRAAAAAVLLLDPGAGPPSAQLASVAFAVLSARDFSTKARSSSQTGSEIVLKSIVTSAPFSGCLFNTIFTTSFRHSGGSRDTSTLSAWRMPTSQRCIVGGGRRNADRCAGASAFSGVTRGAGAALSASAVRAASAFSIAASNQAGCAPGDNQSPRARAADGEELRRVVVLGVVPADQPAGNINKSRSLRYRAAN